MPAARRLLDPYMKALGAAVYLAWQEFKVRHRQYLPDYNTTTKTNLIHRGMVKRAMVLPDKFEGIRPFEPGYNSHYLVIEDEILARFKKMSSKLRTSNVPTHIQKLISEGEIPDLFGHKRIQYLVNVGYVFDPFKMDFERIVISQWTGTVEWFAEVSFKDDDFSISDVFGTPDLFRDRLDDYDDGRNLRPKNPTDGNDQDNDDGDALDDADQPTGDDE